MLLSKIARRYAHAFYETAREAGREAAVLADWQELAQLAGGSPAFAAFLADYSRARSVRRSALDAMFKAKLDPLTWKLLIFLESKKRLGHLEEIGAALLEIYDAARGVLKAALVSAFPLEPAAADGISERIQNRFHKPVEMAVAVDPRLLGGFRFRIDDQVFDYSLRGSLEALHDKLTRA